MSTEHPIIAVTGSSGAGTTTVKQAFAGIFLREGVNAAYVNGSGFRRYGREEMQHAHRESAKGNKAITLFSPEANLFERLEGLFREYSRSGTGLTREYIETEAQAVQCQQDVGSFTPWTEIPEGSELLFYEGLFGGCIEETWTYRSMSPSHNPLIIKERHKLKTRPHTGVDIARWADLLIGVVPSINLEWIQKIHHDCNVKGHSPEAVANTILRHLPDYVGYITPQFSLTDINFQRVPLVDTSNPFIARDIPTLAESMVVIRFREPKNVDFPDLLQRIHNSFMSRPNTLVVPGGEMVHAMSVICAPLVHTLLEKLPRK